MANARLQTCIPHSRTLKSKTPPEPLLNAPLKRPRQQGCNQSDYRKTQQAPHQPDSIPQGERLSHA